MNRLLAIVPRFGVVVALVIASSCGDGATSSPDAAHVSFTAADGSATSLARMKGRPTVVNMWATWCSPCVKEMPAFDRVARSVSRVQVIGVNVSDTAAAAATFASKLGIHYPQYTDPDGTLSVAFSVSGLPATAFVDTDGTVLQVHQGALTESELRDAIATNFHLTATP